MITINNLSFRYRSNLFKFSNPVFSGIDIIIPEGGVCGVLGKNGVGKSTLFNLMSGMLRPAASSGEFSVIGHKPFEGKPSFLEQIYIVPEEFSLPRVSVNTFKSIYAGFYPNFSQELFEKLLELFEVEGNQKFSAMSYGQKKKAYLSFAFACNTKLLLLDEPTNGLDIPSKAAFRKALAMVATDERTILISTHQVRDLEEVLDRVLILNKSKVLLNASTYDITSKLRFGVVSEGEKTLYSQPSVYGTIGVTKIADTQQQSKLDLELLFNAVTNSPDEIAQIFETK